MECLSLCEKPVFVVGAARSGTTWVQCLISAHPDFISRAETHFFDELLYPGVICGGYQLHCPKRIWRDKNLSPAQLVHSFQQLTKGFISLSNKTREKLIEQASKSMLSPAHYLNAIMYNCNDVPEVHMKRWVEKTPIHINYLEDIFYWFPQAKIVCVIRDPVDVILSAHSSMRVPLGIALIDYIRAYQAIKTFLTKHPNFRNSVYFIYYEEIKSQPLSLTKLFEFLEVTVPNVFQILVESKKQFEKLYAGTSLEFVQPEMKNKRSDIPDSIGLINKDYLRAIISYLLPKNYLWERYLDRKISIKKFNFIPIFCFLLKDIFHSLTYILLRRGSWILHSIYFYLKYYFSNRKMQDDKTF